MSEMLSTQMPSWEEVNPTPKVQTVSRIRNTDEIIDQAAVDAYYAAKAGEETNA